MTWPVVAKEEIGFKRKKRIREKEKNESKW